MHTITRYHDFSAGHRVCGHESKCAHLHGHNYRIHFSCRPKFTPCWEKPDWLEHPPEMRQLDNLGRVIDFSVVKEKLCQWVENAWDHRFLVWDKDPMANMLQELDPKGIMRVPFNPTAENMAEHLVTVIGPHCLMQTGVELYRCTIDETRKCSATFSLES